MPVKKKKTKKRTNDDHQNPYIPHKIQGSQPNQENNFNQQP